MIDGVFVKQTHTQKNHSSIHPFIDPSLTSFLDYGGFCLLVLLAMLSCFRDAYVDGVSHMRHPKYRIIIVATIVCRY